jgi:arylsulfatase A-like enzyme
MDMVMRYMRRRPEQLYDIETDPFEMTNRADDPKLANVRARLSAELDRWIRDQRDPGAAMDTHETFDRYKARADQKDHSATEPSHN